MKISMLSVFLTLAFAVAAQAQVPSYKLPVTRDGKTVTRVASTIWSGEYPDPVIDVNAKKAGTTTIEAYASPRQLSKKVSCTIQNGVYHPWSKTKNSVINFYSLTSLVEFDVVRDVLIQDDHDIDLKKGSKVSEVIYYGEGYCGAVNVVGSQRTPFSVFCDAIYENEALVQSTKNDEFHEQWLHVRCAEGSTAFVQDSSLLAQKGVRSGVLRGYGDVGPAK
jgi:hypothetical protein